MNNRQNFSELQRKIFDLTLALYRVTDFFPKGEILRKSLREKANEIFSRVTEYTYGYNALNGGEAVAIFGRIESIKGYLEIARSLKLVRPINISVLEREYQFLADFFERELGANHNEEREEVISKRGEKSTSKTVLETLPTWDEFVPPVEKPVVELSKKVEQGEVPENVGSLTGFTDISDVISERQKQIVEHLKSSVQAKISDFYTAFSSISSKTIQRDLQDLVGKNILKKDGEKRWTVYSLNGVR